MSFHNLIEQPWKCSFTSLMRYTFIEELIENTDVFSNKKFDFVKKHWEKIKHLTLVDPFRLYTLIELLEQTKGVKGDIVECGSYKGGSAILMALWLKENNDPRKIYLLDSFEGLPDPDVENDKGYKKGQFKSNYERLNAKLVEFEVDSNTVVLKGWFNETISKLPNDLEISLFHIDCDLYTSTMDCFPPLYPLVNHQGVVVLDDYNDGGGGEKKAIEEYLSQHKLEEIIEISAAPQSYFIKGRRQVSSDFIKEINNQKYSYSYLNSYKEYLNWIEEYFNLDIINNLNQIKNG